MTRAEMTEIFSVFMLAYPNAEMFKGGSRQELTEKLGQTITLWTACLPDIDFWLGQKAVVQVCRKNKFPPTIAEFREEADMIVREMRSEISLAYLLARDAFNARKGTPEEILSELPDRTRKVIETMGGLDAFIPPGGRMFNMSGFERTYETLLRSNPSGLPGRSGQKQLKG